MGLSPQRTMQRISHTIDNLGSRDIPHAVIHTQDALNSTTLPEAKEHIERTYGHLKEAVKQSGMLSGAIQAIPGVVHEANRLQEVRNQSDGLVPNNKAKNPMKGGNMATVKIKKTGSTDGEPNRLGGGGRFKQMTNAGMSPALASFIGRKKYGAKAMARMAAAGKKG